MGGIASLGFSIPTLIAQVVNFIILFGLLYLVAYKPIMRMLDGRSRKIKESMEQTELIKQQAAQADEEVRQRLDVATKEGQEAVAKAVRAGNEIRQQAQQEARQESETLITRARAEIQRERDEAVGDLRKEFVERSLDKEAHHELIDRVLEESTSLKKN